MSTTCSLLTNLANEILKPQAFNDYCPNGLQIEGARTINKLVTGVTASLELIESAIANKAEAILVHHGYFWKGEAAQIVGMKKNRLKLLLEHDINLLAYHLPLDAHEEFGNNAQLAKQFGWIVEDPGRQDELLFVGSLAQPKSAAEFLNEIAQVTQRQPQHIAPRTDKAPRAGKGAEAKIHRIAWCTGGAQNFIEAALARGVDAFISGEISEPTVHVARECGVHYFAAGHHATERYGVQALGSELASRLGIEHQFIDCDNPV